MNGSRIRKGGISLITCSGTLALAAACASTRSPHRSAPMAGASLPPLPPGSTEESNAAPIALSDAGVEDLLDGQAATASDEPEQPACMWPTKAADKQPCVAIGDLVDDPDPPRHVRVIGNLTMRGMTGTLSANDGSETGVHFDNPQACAGSESETIEGDLVGLAFVDTPSLDFLNTVDGASFAIVHAKVIGPPASACSGIKPRSARTSIRLFDRFAARAALSAVKTNDCLPHTPHEPVHIRITFLENGSVRNVDVDTHLSGGMQVAHCVKNHFLEVKVPAFAGDPITVGKGLVLEP